jgi:hypothetical protein
MAKNKPPRKKGRRVSDSISVPHVPYIGRFWKDYSDEELHGLIPFLGKTRRCRWLSIILGLMVIMILASIVIALINAI